MVREMRWLEGIRCPKCNSDEVKTRGFRSRQAHRQRYLCHGCRQQFDDLTGTIFEGHHQPLRTWLVYLSLMWRIMGDNSQREELEKQIQKLEMAKASRVLESDVADASIVALREKLEIYNAKLSGNGAVAQGDGTTAVGAGSMLVDGDIHGNVTVYQSLPKDASTLSPIDALQEYLKSLIAEHQLLRLQGIRAGSQPLSVSLEKVYVSLTMLDQYQVQGIAKAGQVEQLDSGGGLDIAAAMRRHRRLVIIGDPGCGKTTLLSYVALTYARVLLARLGNQTEGGQEIMKQRLRLDETNYLPILLPLRHLGAHLKNYPSSETDGPALLLNYLFEYFKNHTISLPPQFFDAALNNGKAVLLLDGMDEVADKATRQRVARLIERFVGRYPNCRFVVTSREVGYEGAARIGAEFGLARVRNFSPAEVRQFVRDWTRVVETTLAQSEAFEVQRLAAAQAEKLIQAIDSNPRVAELAVNPLLLTVIALVHRSRAQLPERRSELYEEAVEVLLGHWDEGKGLETKLPVADLKLDSGDRRALLEPVAFWMHEKHKREIELDELRMLLEPVFQNLVSQPQKAAMAVEEFLKKINERSGLLVERGLGMYGFAHLTFQEYLAARELAGRKNALAYTVQRLPDTWWREVILLEAGYLSTQGKRRVSELIAAIMNANITTQAEPHHHLLLAAECLFDVGNVRVEGNLLGEVRKRLQQQVDAPLQKDNKAALLGKLAAMNALAKVESGKFTSQYWKQPWGEPEWVTIPTGEFWMGGNGPYDGEPIHKLSLPEYKIARVLITNAQYAIYVHESGAKEPEHWRGGGIPSGLENHPVVYVSWDDAITYCRWLGEKTNQIITLLSEAEWEKAAKGSGENNAYPWDQKWKELHCNSRELGLDSTTPVGLFLNGASSYGLLDMSGNVWEWTRTISDNSFKYFYQPDDGREDLKTSDSRVLRGGSFVGLHDIARCASRDGSNPVRKYWDVGFRVMVSQ